jgi:hypothetical protein
LLCKSLLFNKPLFLPFWCFKPSLHFEDMIFPCIIYSSKHEGLAGTRFGWGLYEDSVLAQNVAQVVNVLTLGLSVDVQLRVLASIQAIIGNNIG